MHTLLIFSMNIAIAAVVLYGGYSFMLLTIRYARWAMRKLASLRR
jgi:hypothetical protein